MLTGTPLDLTPFGGVLAALGWLYWFAALALVVIALWLPKAWWKKLLAVALVAGGVVYPVLIRPVSQHVDAARQQQDESKARLAEATALFEQRCKGAGEKIHRTVDKVDGVVWMKWREQAKNQSDQFKLDDPYGQDCGGEDCISLMLRVTSGAALNPEEAKRHQSGYRFVETTDPRTKKRVRYTGVIKVTHVRTPAQIEEYKRNSNGVDPGPNVYGFGLEQQEIETYTARFGITWDDISTREDRERWIAGGSLKLIDLRTNDVVAERVGYMMDRGQGSRAGFRSPWLFAPQTACPAFELSEARNPILASRSRFFVYRVLIPIQGD